MKTIKNTILASITTALLLGTFSAHAAVSLASQLNSQKAQLRTALFDPASDAYFQVHARKNALRAQNLKAELDSQKRLLRPQHFNFKSDVFIQISSNE